MRRLFGSEYWKLYAVGLFVTLLASWFSVGYYHPDEHFQILEFAGYRLGQSPASDLPWEFREQIRPALQPVIACGVIAVAKIVGIGDPFLQAFLLRLLTGLFSWYVICRISLLLAKNFSSERSRYLFLATMLFLWFIPYLNVRFSSETLAGTSLLLALCLLLEGESDGQRRMLPIVFSGLLLGFSFFLRFQMAFAILGVAVWLLFVRKAGPRLLVTIAFSGLVAMALSVAADYWFYGNFVLTPVRYFIVNIIQDRASDWGVMPWYYYFPEGFLKIIPPMSLILIPAFIAGIILKPKHLFSFVVIPFLAAHILVPHKEMRFLFPMVVPFIFLAWTGLDCAARRIKYKAALLWTFRVVAGLNVVFLVYAVFFPAQEAMKYYRFIYDYHGPGKQLLLCEKQPVYQLVGVEANFYKPKGVRVLKMAEGDTIAVCLAKEQAASALFISQSMTLRQVTGNCKAERIYCILPDWLRKFNINNWQDRSRVWSIYRVTAVPAGSGSASFPVPR
jgi:GPI mannosyltransferase 3